MCVKNKEGAFGRSKERIEGIFWTDQKTDTDHQDQTDRSNEGSINVNQHFAFFADFLQARNTQIQLNDPSLFTRHPAVTRGEKNEDELCMQK